MFSCDFCKKDFAFRGNMLSHQRSAKYCLDIQGKNCKAFECNFCVKNFTTHQNLNDHLVSCKEKEKKQYESKRQELEKQYESKRQEIEKQYESKRQEIEKQIILVKKGWENILEKQDHEYHTQLDEKDKTIAKLEAKLEKFENAVIANSMTRSYEENGEDIQNEKEDIPIPIKEQMNSIIIEDAKDEVEYSNITLNNVVISSRPIDHYVNATQLCQAGGKKFNDWFRLDATKELMNELSSDAGIPASLFVEANRGRTSKYTQGSWIHPDLSIQLAQWISPKFAIQVSKWIRSLFSVGSVEIDLALLRDKDRDIRIKDHRIKQLETVCLSKQRRVEYPEKNVIYILTTDDHLLRRTYIIGKAKNLTNRLGTYNKTCDHTVVHYRECKNDEDMHTAETLVLNKLKDYREQANRDRFILPNGYDISFFTAIVDQCIEFI